MRTLDVLLLAGPDEHDRVRPLAGALRRAGHRVELVLSVDEALGLPTPDALVLTAAAGPELLHAFEAGPCTPWRAVLADEPDFDVAREALRAGADELLVRPTGEELVAALRPRRAGTPRIHTTRHHAEAYLVGADLPAATLRPVLDLSAFLTRLGLERAWRVRAATALGLVVDNARRHAYPDADGPLEVTAELVGERLCLGITDQGAGFDVTATGSDEVQGLDLVRALCERVEVTSDPTGTRLALELELAPARFDEEPLALDELDHLDAASCRALRALAADADAGPELPASLLPTVGRLVAATARAADPTACLFA